MPSFFVRMVSNMKDYSKMSDAEIAMRVACAIDDVEVDCNGKPKFAVDCYMCNSSNSIKWLRVGRHEFDLFDPCNRPSDAWPIINRERIGVYPSEGPEFMPWIAAKNAISVTDKNPLRAAMIVYLMMKDEEK